MSSNTSTFGQLDAGPPLVGTDILAIQRVDGLNYRITADEFATFIGGGIESINGDVTAAQLLAGGTGIDLVDAGALHTFSIDATVATLTGVQILTGKTMDDITNDIHANTVHEFVRNVSGGILTAGTPVYLSGFHVGSCLPTVDKADADDVAAMPAIGIITTDVANNATGDITVIGVEENLDTSAWAVGDDLFVSTTAGVLTNVRPNSTAQVQILAHVLRVHATMGVIGVRIDQVLDNPNLADGTFWVGNATAIATAVTMSGDATMDNAGVVTVAIASTDLTDSANLARNTDNLGFFAATTSLQLLGVISDETGSGLLVFGTSPTLITPALGTPSALVGTNITGTAAGLTAGNVTTNANLTGDVTSVGNATTIGAGKVTVAMLADGVDGELITWSAAGVAATVAVGTVGQVLTSGGVGVAPTFQNLVWKVIETYETGSEEPSHTFTFSAIDFDDVAYLVLEIDLSVSGAADIQLKVNSLVAAYFADGIRTQGGTSTPINVDNAAEWTLITSTDLGGATGSCAGIVFIQLGKAGTKDHPQMSSSISVTGAQNIISGGNTTATASLTDVIVETSANNFQVGSRMTLYEVRRA